MLTKIFSLIISLTILSYTQINSQLHSFSGRLNLPPDHFKGISQISISLEGADQIAFLNDKNSFSFHNINPGMYIINVNDIVYQFEQVLIEVTAAEVKAYQYNVKNGKGLKHKIPFEISPVFKIKYEEDSPNVIATVIKSPYAIIIGVTVLLFACMQMMPQDQLKESFEQMNKQMGQMGQMNTMFKQ